MQLILSFAAKTGDLCFTGGADRILSPESNRGLIYEMLDDDQIRQYEATGDLDLAYELEGVARFRVNVVTKMRSFSPVKTLVAR